MRLGSPFAKIDRVSRLSGCGRLDRSRRDSSALSIMSSRRPKLPKLDGMRRAAGPPSPGSARPAEAGSSELTVMRVIIPAVYAPGASPMRLSRSWPEGPR